MIGIASRTPPDYRSELIKSYFRIIANYQGETPTSSRMKHSSLRIDDLFLTISGLWRVTDVGTRTIVAILLDGDDASWYGGPPYRIEECVFDEFDLEDCISLNEVRASAVHFSHDMMTITIDYGLMFDVPLSISPRLQAANRADLALVEVSRTGLRWPRLDEDLSIAGLLRTGYPLRAHETIATAAPR